MKLLKLLPLFLIVNVYSTGDSIKDREPGMYDITNLHPHTFSLDQKNCPIINDFRLICYEQQRDEPNIFPGFKEGKAIFKFLEDGIICCELKKNKEPIQIYLIDAETLVEYKNNKFLVINSSCDLI